MKTEALLVLVKDLLNLLVHLLKRLPRLEQLSLPLISSLFRRQTIEFVDQGLHFPRLVVNVLKDLLPQVLLHRIETA